MKTAHAVQIFAVSLLLMLVGCQKNQESESKTPSLTEQVTRTEAAQTGASSSLPTDVRSSGPLLLEDLDGEAVALFEGNSKQSTSRLQVFLLVRTDCPIANRYAPDIQKLHDKYSSQGVNLTLVYPDPTESIESIRQHVRDFGFTCRVLRDPEHQLVNLTGASVTPEACVFTPENRMIYRGRIDNRFVDFGKTRTVTTSHELIDVVEATLEGKRVSLAWKPAVGCPISALP